MRVRPIKLEFEPIEQVFQFEVSRFSFLESDKQLEQRKLYRDLEAAFRDSVRTLSDLEDLRQISFKVYSRTLSDVEVSIRNVCKHHKTTISEDLAEALELCCDTLSKLSELEKEELRDISYIESITMGFERLKRTLGVVHRM